MNDPGNIQKYGIKLSPQHFPVGTQFRKSSTPFGMSDPNHGKVLTATGVYYNGPGSFVIYHDGVEYIEGVQNTVNAYWVTDIIKQGDGPVLFSGYSGRNWAKEYIKEALHFVYAPKDHHWDGTDTRVCLKTHYVFFTFHDIIYMMLEKYGKDPSECFDYDKIEDALRNDLSTSFIKKRYSGLKFDFFSSVAGYSVSKKRLNRWFKQNLNRFKKSVKQVKKENSAAEDKLYWDEVEAERKFEERNAFDDTDGSDYAADDTAFKLNP